MKKTIGFIGTFLLLCAFWSFCPKGTQATSGATTAVFSQTSTALTASPNVRVCVMSQGQAPTSGLVKEKGSTGDKVQGPICDYIYGYYLGKKLTVNITGAMWFYAEVDQNTKFNHDGSATNYLIIPSGGSHSEVVR